MVVNWQNKFYFFLIFLCAVFVSQAPTSVYATKKAEVQKKVIKNKAKKTSIKKDKNYRRYTLKRGDTLAKVAKASGCTVEAIKNANPDIKPNNLKVGSTIKIPVVVTKKEQNKKVEKDTIVYKVKKGDTLSKIAKRYSLSQEEIKKLNNINDNNIVVGMNLLVKKLNGQGRKTKTEQYYSITDVDEDTFDEGDSVETEDLTLLDKKETNTSNLPLYTLSKEQLNKMIDYSLGFLGADYKFGGNSVEAIDCSAFVKKVFKEIDINLPRTSREQFTLGVDVPFEELKEGDLLFFAKKKRISHVGIYIGNDMFIHAARKGKGVIVTKLDSPYVKKHLVGAKRLFTIADNSIETTEKKDNLTLIEKPLIN